MGRDATQKNPNSEAVRCFWKGGKLLGRQEPANKHFFIKAILLIECVEIGKKIPIGSDKQPFSA